MSFARNSFCSRRSRTARRASPASTASRATRATRTCSRFCLRDELSFERAAAVPLQGVREMRHSVFGGVIETEPRVRVRAERHRAALRWRRARYLRDVRTTTVGKGRVRSYASTNAEFTRSGGNVDRAAVWIRSECTMITIATRTMTRLKMMVTIMLQCERMCVSSAYSGWRAWTSSVDIEQLARCQRSCVTINSMKPEPMTLIGHEWRRTRSSGSTGRFL